METIKKTFKVIMLPTEKDGAILKFDASDTLIVAQGTIHSNVPFKKFDLYIISDDEIKEGDNVAHKDRILTVGKNRGLYLSVYELSHIDVRTDACKKVIASTDKEITPKSWINKSFVNDYVEAKNGGNPIIKVDLEIDTIPDLQSYHEQTKKCDNIDVFITNEDSSVIIIPIKQIFTYNDVAHHIHSALSAFGVHLLEHGSAKGFDSDKWIEENIK